MVKIQEILEEWKDADRASPATVRKRQVRLIKALKVALIDIQKIQNGYTTNPYVTQKEILSILKGERE